MHISHAIKRYTSQNVLVQLSLACEGLLVLLQQKLRLKLTTVIFFALVTRYSHTLWLLVDVVPTDIKHLTCMKSGGRFKGLQLRIVKWLSQITDYHISCWLIFCASKIWYIFFHCVTVLFFFAFPKLELDWLPLTIIITYFTHIRQVCSYKKAK